MLSYAQFDTVFLDVGNTLISIDFDWVATELASLGFPTTAETLRRAEAAARPDYADRLFVKGLPEGADLFRAYLLAMIERVDGIAALSGTELDALLTNLRGVLRPAGTGASLLWRSVMPRVPEALAKMRDLGVTLVIVSNSDGTVERSIEAAGLRGFFDAVVDSAVAGFEKPDPRIFLHALEVSQSAADRVLHVGDLYHADVLGARGAGLQAVLLDPYGDWPPLDVDVLPDVWAVAEHLAAAR